MAPEDSLKVLLAREGGAQSLRLHAWLTKAELETSYLFRAAFVAGGLFVLSFAILGYCAVFLPDFFFNSPHLVVKSLTLLCLASFISELEFLGYRLWYRMALTRLRRECHQLLLPLVEYQPEVLRIQPPVGKPVMSSSSAPEKPGKKE